MNLNTGKQVTLEAAPAKLVGPLAKPHFGVYTGVVPNWNLDAIQLGFLSSLRRPLRKKSWQYVAFVKDELVTGTAIISTGYLTGSFSFFFDRQTGRLVEHGVNLPLGAGYHQALHLTRFSGMGMKTTMEDHTEQSRRVIRSLAGGDGNRIELDASITDDNIHVVPITVVAPVPNTPGLRCHATQKAVGLPVVGSVRVGDHVHRLDGALAIYDRSEGYPARHTSWKWAAAAGKTTEGKRVGLNLVADFNDSLENVIWIDGQPHFVGPVNFSYDNNDPRSHWTIRDDHGKINLKLEPWGERRSKLSLGIISDRYRQPFGNYFGTIRDGAGNDHHLDGVVGVAEHHQAVW